MPKPAKRSPALRHHYELGGDTCLACHQARGFPAGPRRGRQRRYWRGGRWCRTAGPCPGTPPLPLTIGPRGLTGAASKDRELDELAGLAGDAMIAGASSFLMGVLILARLASRRS